jgi:Holliday junction resolvase RusA-like endonuclease
MDVCFELQGKGFSVNAAYYATRRIKTTACKEWETDIAHQLDEVKDLVDLVDTFKERGGTFAMRVVWEYPPHIYLNRQGQVSAKTFDVDNCCKLLIDQIFMGCMGVDDRFLTKLTSEKRAGPMHRIIVTITLQ